MYGTTALEWLEAPAPSPSGNHRRPGHGYATDQKLADVLSRGAAIPGRRSLADVFDAAHGDRSFRSMDRTDGPPSAKPPVQVGSPAQAEHDAQRHDPEWPERGASFRVAGDAELVEKRYRAVASPRQEGLRVSPDRDELREKVANRVDNVCRSSAASVSGNQWLSSRNGTTTLNFGWTGSPEKRGTESLDATMADMRTGRPAAAVTQMLALLPLEAELLAGGLAADAARAALQHA
jgi:hypothetical protein